MTADHAPGHEPRTRLAAYALCVDADGRLLLCRIAPGYPAAGMWTLPGGGVNFGEDPAQAALRELAEETGLEGRVGRLAFVHSSAGVGGGRQWHGVRIVYRVDVIGGELRDELDESTDRAAWISVDEIEKLPIVDLVRRALLEIPEANREST